MRPRGNGNDKKQEERYRSTGLLALSLVSWRLRKGTKTAVGLVCNWLSLSREKKHESSNLQKSQTKVL